MTRTPYLTFLLALLLGAQAVMARGVYQEPQDFIREVFYGSPPKPRTLWLAGDLKQQVNRLLGHRYPRLRIRYWQGDGRTVWILEEIGKEKPITTGVVVRNGRIERIKVLVFRESRGWEVRHDFFTRQFHQAGLTPEGRLDRPIDGISGATLSVRALKKIARLALLLDRHVTRNTQETR